MHKSPFFVVRNFVSPLACEDILSRLDLSTPDYDQTGVPIKSIHSNRLTEIRLLPMIKEVIPDLEKYYNFEYRALTPFIFEWYVEHARVDRPKCDNAQLIGKKWTKINENDFTGVLFLKDYNDSAPFDDEFEVYGGCLDFPNHGFKFNPNRGTLLIFPAGSNFINFTTPILSGESVMLKFNIVAETPYTYDMSDFPGDYTVWFK